MERINRNDLLTSSRKFIGFNFNYGYVTKQTHAPFWKQQIFYITINMVWVGQVFDYLVFLAKGWKTKKKVESC